MKWGHFLFLVSYVQIDLIKFEGGSFSCPVIERSFHFSSCLLTGKGLI